MINRRSFLGSLLAGTAGGSMVRGNELAAEVERFGDHPPSGAELRQYWKDLAACNPNALGVPRRQSLVEQAFHPVAPERVIICDKEAQRCMVRQHTSLKRWLRREEAAMLSRWQGELMPVAKLDAVIGLMDRLTAYYRRPELFATWARTLTRREGLGTTGIGHGVGVLHDFQRVDCRPVHTASRLVDWWLALFPDGLDWQALDERPVYVMIGPVQEVRTPGPYLRTLEVMSKAVRPAILRARPMPSDWARRLANMTPADAARVVNLLAVRWLQAEDRAAHAQSAPRSGPTLRSLA